MDCSPPGSSAHGEGCHFLLQRIFLTQGSNPHCCIGRQFVYHRYTWEAPWFHYNLHKSCIWLCFCLLFSLRHSLLGVCGMWVCVCLCVFCQSNTPSQAGVCCLTHERIQVVGNALTSPFFLALSTLLCKTVPCACTGPTPARLHDSRDRWHCILDLGSTEESAQMTQASRLALCQTGTQREAQKLSGCARGRVGQSNQGWPGSRFITGTHGRCSVQVWPVQVHLSDSSISHWIPCASFRCPWLRLPCFWVFLVTKLCMLHAELLRSCLTLCNPVDYRLPGSSVHGILQARIPDWVAIPSSRGSSWPRDWTHASYVSCIGRQVLYH